MKSKKKTAVMLSTLLLLAAAAVGILMSFHIIDFKFYPKKAQTLDLRGEEISFEHYEAVKQALPECEILWDIPFQGSRYPSDTTELAVTDLEEAMQMLDYFPKLETLNAMGCEDLSLLPELLEENPALNVLFQITLDGNTYAQDAGEIETSAISEEELALLPYMTELKQVTLIEGADAGNLVKLGEYCRAQGIEVQLQLDGQQITEDTKELTIENINDVQAQLLALMPGLETIHFPEPEAKAEYLFALEEKLPDAAITWEKTVLGVTFSQDVQEINLTDIISRTEADDPEKKSAYEAGMAQPVMGTREKVPSSVKILDNRPLPDKEDTTDALIAEVEAALAYFPEVQKLEMCGAWLNNEAMAQFRERHREDYKVVWTVQCGILATRTDATLFMPTKFNVSSGGFSDLGSYNLRYCEDMVAIDLGHMNVTDLEFVRHMPELKYLDLTMTHVKDLSPLSDCKKLVFLAIYWDDRIEDYSPLLGCTALEDLNIGETFGDITPVLQMTWLKNLWMVGCPQQSYSKVAAALPDTRIGYNYGNPDDGWRSLPNYFNLRDALLMFYLS